MLLAIDPGQCSGWALFTTTYGREVLLACGLDDPSQCRWHVASVLSRVVIEQPRIYPGGRTKNPNDVLSVAVNAGEWAGRYLQQGVKVEYVTPSGWKGQVRKDVSHARILAKLASKELELVPPEGARKSGGLPKSDRHNLLDAIGIGLWAVGR